MKKLQLRQLIRELIKENDPFYKSDSYLDDPKPSRENVPDNITSVIDDMTITMGEEAFITAVFEALPLETAKSVLRIITKANPIQHPSGPVDYDWLNEEITSQQFVDMVNDEFDVETLELMKQAIEKQITMLSTMQGIANRKTVKGFGS
jgi:hypothetical protein